MARTVKVLTPEQGEALEAVRLHEMQRRAMRKIVEAEAKELAARHVEARMAERTIARDRAVARAVSLGVPKMHLTTADVLGTAKDGVNRILQAMRERGEDVDLAVATAPSLRWIDEARMVAHVSIPNFPTTSEDPDYPNPLVGVVRRAPGTDIGWTVETDPTDDGEMPGHLRWEMSLPLGPGHVVRHIERLVEVTDELGDEIDDEAALA